LEEIMRKLGMIALVSLIVPSFAHAERTTPVQREIAAQLRTMTGPGGPLENVKKGSIKASQIVQRGWIHGAPHGPLEGPSLRFTVNGLERKLTGGLRGSFELLKVTGQLMTESYPAGPVATVNKVTVLKAPRQALE
jgi:hypothetical protein